MGAGVRVREAWRSFLKTYADRGITAADTPLLRLIDADSEGGHAEGQLFQLVEDAAEDREDDHMLDHHVAGIR